MLKIARILAKKRADLSVEISTGSPWHLELDIFEKNLVIFNGVTQIRTLLGPKSSLPPPAKGVIKCVVSGVILHHVLTASFKMIFEGQG